MYDGQKGVLSMGEIMGSYPCIAQVCLEVTYEVVLLCYEDLNIDYAYEYVGDYTHDYVVISYACTFMSYEGPAILSFIPVARFLGVEDWSLAFRSRIGQFPISNSAVSVVSLGSHVILGPCPRPGVASGYGKLGIRALGLRFL
uniref:Uncharacterized protein n=1 Tax=Solanum tuberosum TaxID=4113 RepID=M1DUJ0_SOLTU